MLGLPLKDVLRLIASIEFILLLLNGIHCVDLLLIKLGCPITCRLAS